MDIETRLAAIEQTQSRILNLLSKGTAPSSGTMTLKEAASYAGYSPDHFRRLAVEQRIVPFSRPSGQQKGKLLFRKADLDTFLDSAKKQETETGQPGRRRQSKNIRLW